jgi:hypothetical protein
MNMRMNFELLAPGMQHTEEADLRSEVSRVARHFEEGFRAGTKQKIVEDLLVLHDQWRQATGQGEHDMGVGRREKFLPTRSDPPFPSGDLTLRAVSISAAIEGDGTMPATGALIEMAAKCGGTTPLNGPQYFHMLPTEPVAVSFDESLSRSADDIGHLERRPAHLLLAWRLVVQW